MTPLADLLGRLAGPDRRTVLIVGDLMLDHFVIGGVERISPEAPVPVVRFDREEYRLGGAANVAHNVAALGGRVEMVGIAGDDADGVRIRTDLERLQVGTRGIVTDPARCTTRKMRVVTTRNQQVARVDYEDDAEVSGALEASVVDRVETLAAGMFEYNFGDSEFLMLFLVLVTLPFAADRERVLP